MRRITLLIVLFLAVAGCAVAQVPKRFIPTDRTGNGTESVDGINASTGAFSTTLSVGGFPVATGGSIPTNYVTTDTVQTISAKKTFTTSQDFLNAPIESSRFNTTTTATPGLGWFEFSVPTGGGWWLFEEEYVNDIAFFSDIYDSIIYSDLDVYGDFSTRSGGDISAQGDVYSNYAFEGSYIRPNVGGALSGSFYQTFRPGKFWILAEEGNLAKKVVHYDGTSETSTFGEASVGTRTSLRGRVLTEVTAHPTYGVVNLDAFSTRSKGEEILTSTTGVTLGTNQTITGEKSFVNTQTFFAYNHATNQTMRVLNFFGGPAITVAGRIGSVSGNDLVVQPDTGQTLRLKDGAGVDQLVIASIPNAPNGLTSQGETVLTSVDVNPTNYVTLGTNQTITGLKTFTIPNAAMNFNPTGTSGRVAITGAPGTQPLLRVQNTGNTVGISASSAGNFASSVAIQGTQSTANGVAIQATNLNDTFYTPTCYSALFDRGTAFRAKNLDPSNNGYFFHLLDYTNNEISRWSGDGTIRTSGVEPQPGQDFFIKGPVSIQDSAGTTQIRIGSIPDCPNGLTSQGETVLTSVDANPGIYVTLATGQTISAQKTYTAAQYFNGTIRSSNNLDLVLAPHFNRKLRLENVAGATNRRIWIETGHDVYIDGPVSIRDSSLTTQFRIGSIPDAPNGLTSQGDTVLTSVSAASLGYMTLDTAQTVTGAKTFSSAQGILLTELGIDPAPTAGVGKLFTNTTTKLPQWISTSGAGHIALLSQAQTWTAAQTFTPSTNLNAILAVSGQTASVIKGQSNSSGYALEGINSSTGSAIRANASGTGTCMNYATTNGRVVQGAVAGALNANNTGVTVQYRRAADNTSFDFTAALMQIYENNNKADTTSLFEMTSTSASNAGKTWLDLNAAAAQGGNDYILRASIAGGGTPFDIDWDGNVTSDGEADFGSYVTSGGRADLPEGFVSTGSTNNPVGQVSTAVAGNRALDVSATTGVGVFATATSGDALKGQASSGGTAIRALATDANSKMFEAQPSGSNTQPMYGGSTQQGGGINIEQGNTLSANNGSRVAYFKRNATLNGFNYTNPMMQLEENIQSGGTNNLPLVRMNAATAHNSGKTWLDLQAPTGQTNADNILNATVNGATVFKVDWAGNITASGGIGFDQYLDLKDLGANPSTPASGYGRAYVKNDDLWYIDDNGVAAQALTSAAAQFSTVATQKTTPVTADKILVEDSEASNAKKWMQIGDVLTQWRNFRDAEDDTLSATTSTDWQQKLRLTTDSGFKAGKYRIAFQCSWYGTNLSSQWRGQIEIDDATQVIYREIEPNDTSTSLRNTASGFAIVDLTAGQHTVDLDYSRIGSAGTFAIDEARITIERVE